MKNLAILIIVLSTMLITIDASAQRGNRVNRGYGYYHLGGVLGYVHGYNNGQRQARAYDRDNRSNYDRIYDRMSREDRRYLRRLNDRLEERIDRASYDGHIDRWERQRIRDVENEIEDLFERYRRRDRNRGYYRTGCR